MIAITLGLKAESSNFMFLAFACVAGLGRQENSAELWSSRTFKAFNLQAVYMTG